MARRPDREELAAAICSKFCKGLKVTQIKAEVERELRVHLTRETPYDVLRQEALAGRLQYEAPTDSELAERIRNEYPWLRGVRIVRTVEASVVAYHAARAIMDIMLKWKRPVLHIGFGGGGLIDLTVRQLADLLRKGTAPSALDRLVVHALMPAASNPSLSPNSFLRWFFEPPQLPLYTEFVGLPTPSLVPSEALEKLRGLDGVRETFSQADKIDVILTSAGAHWDRGCSSLHQLHEEKAPGSTKPLRDAGCVGDVLWQPFGPNGPLDQASGYRAVTLVDLNRLPKMVKEEKAVVLALAPCGSCHRPKTEILRSVLDYHPRMITHLVADNRTAMGLFR